VRTQARVVVVGGGCVGASVLYGLAKRGWGDCVLLERSRVAGASTRLAGGFIPTYVRGDAPSRMINATIGIYRGLEADTGQAVGWHPCGQLRIARDPLRMQEYQSYMNIAEAIGANAALLSPREAVGLWPLLDGTQGILGALYHPDDGYVAPTDVTMALLRGARDRGAAVHENTAVTGITRAPSGEWRVATTQGSITCEHVVLATGCYARQTGAMLGLDIPAVPVVVQYWFTDALPEIQERKRLGLPEMPITRDDHFLGYMREEGDGLMFGTYERPEHLQLFGLDGVPDTYDGDPLPADFDAHAWGFQRAAELMPAFARAGIRANIRGPMQMTPDGMPLVGPAWGLRNVWLAEGVPGGILWGGGIGHFLSEWIVEGGTSLDMNDVDARRFGPHATKEWTRLKAVALWGAHSDILPPGHELPAARPAKTTPAYDRLTALGAVWGTANGWEVANWHAPPDVDRAERQSYRRSDVDAWVADEALAVRRGVGLIDASAAARFEVSGPAAVAYLDRVLATRLPSVGMAAAGYQLFDTGGVRAAYTVARLGETLFQLVAAPRAERLAFDELWRRLPPGDGVTLRNATMERGCFVITGPRARAVLADVMELDLSNEACPPGCVRVASVGLADDVRVIRVGSTGELSWELHHPIAYQRHLLDRLLAAGAAHGLRLIGQLALDGLRLEKSYPAVGPDLNIGISAVEAGIADGFDLAKGDFIGRDAILDQREQAPRRRLATISIATGDASVLGQEGVYHEGGLVGRITSGGFSATFGHDIALALLPPALARPGTELTVPVLDSVRPARVVAPSPYDPEHLRERA
jgi:dimethylglycine dehydrogenase